VAVSRAERRAAREPLVTAAMGARSAPAALDILELVELAWHDCYGEVTPPDDVVADIVVCARGDLDRFAAMARLAVEDSRDLRLAADAVRSGLA
jgi:hypothetical protein